MSTPLLERLRAALAREYEVERQLGAGGMGAVFLARDVRLQRHVAIKILRPEFATATAAERFLREARVLASLKHPNVVPVHSAGEADGLFYYVMEYVEGVTLEERLERGPLTDAEVVGLGRDLLEALETAHAHGVIHRDIKPSNVFLVEGQGLLADFGLAKSLDEESPPLTEPGLRLGTPAYMPPEQFGGEATERTDLYAVGMSLYEALTGRRWSIATPSEEVDWSDVPRRLAVVLKKALAWSPDKRWESASEFRVALERAARSPLARRLTWAGAAVVVMALAGLAGFWAIRAGESTAATVSDLAMLPIHVVGPRSETIDSVGLALVVIQKLKLLPDVRVVPTSVSFPWWSRVTEGGGVAPERAAAEELGARYAAGATVIVEEDGVSVQLDVYDATGALRPEGGPFALDRPDLASLSDSIVRRLQTVLLGAELQDIPRLTPDPQALTWYALGERAFERGAWTPALQYYERAVARDSTFIQAWWHLANVHRWLPDRGPYPADFGRLFELYGSSLGPLDSMLLVAQLAPAGPERLRTYRRAHELYAQDDFAAFLLGEELFNRGPLWGESLARAADALDEAVAVRSSWVPAYIHLIWANIRLGRAEEARRVLDAMPPISASLEEGWTYPRELFEHAFVERFDPEEAVARLEMLMAHPVFGSPEWMLPLSRWVGAFDLPHTQVRVGRLVLDRVPVRSLRAGGHTALGLGFVRLGQADSAFAHFDSAAAAFGTPEAQVEALEWRLLPSSLGLPLATVDQRTAARARLEEIVGTAERRAVWALAMDSYARGDTTAGRRLAEQLALLAPADPGDGLERFLQAVDEAARDDYRAALSTSQGLLALQVSTVQLLGGSTPTARLGDPFARSVLHLKRGDWYAAIGDLEAADREWTWYEAVDVEGFPAAEPAQAGEIDWALGTYGRFRRGMAAFERGDFDAACRHLTRVVELWSDADGSHAALLGAARPRAGQACGGLGI
ncbi:MAG: protein kinase [Gemmatimonadetes bacterium]|uniref:Protein kinase n=1 Tax=Candidatus Kutchimonas denitrificans TaxID=3056748 RepID=A0AAE5C946_9BACT|nr:protein kinase [Gemmatimonadota bacterium]NIR75106.1 protein kinase [Candidatus Kutchimonas denitrificans]NIS00938.1 protein kinase [Gemmatimonadota bacterium]NIT66555.1 protein kinase [Gemmatimonadota bacterium]NIU52901.1 protein kinase [Gemmatimonadota bacterium]